MKIRLDQVVDEPFDWLETLELTADELDIADVKDITHVECRGRITPTSPGHLLHASLSYVQTLECTRCLASFEMPVETEVNLLLEVGKPEAKAEERELNAKDVGVLYLPDPELDTRPIMVEQLSFGVPMKPLCREACAGLCSGCGKDLNEGPCDCRPRVDPRWSALRGLDPT